MELLEVAKCGLEIKKEKKFGWFGLISGFLRLKNQIKNEISTYAKFSQLGSLKHSHNFNIRSWEDVTNYFES